MKPLCANPIFADWVLSNSCIILDPIAYVKFYLDMQLIFIYIHEIIGKKIPNFTKLLGYLESEAAEEEEPEDAAASAFATAAADISMAFRSWGSVSTLPIKAAFSSSLLPSFTS